MEKKERKVMDKKEQAVTVKIQKWMRCNLNDRPVYGWEVKYPRKEEYKFNQDKSFAKELRNLLIWQRDKFIYKFSDASMFGTPHDGFTAHGWSCFIFTWDGKKIYIIDAITIQGLVDDNYPGLDEKMAMVICDYKGELK
jgi:hypothetical protein